ncbi:MAG: D-alanyl-D-alanine carboxypeptidase [Deltaproteobacteria bacterium]|nr:D-alanyl-D-alanine carboxypeptidase [Deltaproteobacteria bacterium]
MLGVVSLGVPTSAGARERTIVGPDRAETAKLVKSAIVLEPESGLVLFEKDSHHQGPPASMTKMMLMLLVAEGVRNGSLHWNDPVRVSERASKMGGSQVYLKPGEVFTLGEMMAAIVIHSANDAAYAVAERVAGSAPDFVNRMNERARELGLKETQYRSVHGLPPEAGKPADLSSAHDLSLLAQKLIAFPEILKWSGTKKTKFRNDTLILTNTNRLVQENDWIDGLKTGSYGAAGFSVTATGRRDGMRLIAVVMGAPDRNTCFAAAEQLLKNAFAEYQMLAPIHEGDVVANDVAVKRGRPRFVRVVAGGTLTVLSKRGQSRHFGLELSLPPAIEAPLTARQVVGQVIVHEGEHVVGTVPAVAADDVEVGGLWDRVF